jgi:hypothetical protein
VADTVTRLYQIGGATPVEARCLTPITAKGAHAVNQAFDGTTPAQDRAAVKCVGSKARLLLITKVLGEWMLRHPTG